MPDISFTAEELTKAFEFLDELRESGITNMWGAGEYVERRFSWEDPKATKALLLWMKTFTGQKPVAERVQLAFDKL
jgi:hypothetical protein